MMISSFLNKTYTPICNKRFNYESDNKNQNVTIKKKIMRCLFLFLSS